MKELKIDLENCHGINKLDYNFNFDKKDYIIYATNGTMKTSFYKTFEDYENGIDSKDEFFTDRISKRIILDENNNNVNVENILLVGNSNFSVSDSNMTSLLVNNKLKKQYDQLFSNLNKSQEQIEKNIKSKSGEKKDTFFQDLKINSFVNVKDSFFEEKDFIDFKDIKYSTIFNDDNLKIFNQEIIIESISEYIDLCNTIIGETGIFIKDCFELYHLKSIVKVLKSNNYFAAGHKLKLKEKEKYVDYDEQKIDNLIFDIDKKIENDTKIAAVNLSLTNKISSQKLNVFLSQNQWIIPLLIDIPKLKLECWHYILSQNKDISKMIIEYKEKYSNEKKEIERITFESNKEENMRDWSDATKEFNNKFPNMPFKLHVSNLSDIILKNSVCSLKYEYSDFKEKNSNVNINTLKDNLSKGEINAFSILNLIFEIKYRIKNQIETIIIIDDITDSFDYKNKYAIVEYLKSLADNSLFHLIILTHNFDFYRTCSSRIGLYRLSVIKNSEIKLVDFHYTQNVFDSFKNQLDKPKYFISSIPFVRNIIEMLDSNKNDNYIFLTNTLHYKENTNKIIISDISNIFFTVINKETKPCGANYLDILFDTADSFVKNSSQIDLSNKLVLSIAIRMKLEIYLFKKINDWNIINGFKSNQTKQLIDYCIDQSLLSEKEIEISESVKIMTSENIHVNAFMYEPIIDMSDDELISLYNEIKNLEND